MSGHRQHWLVRLYPRDWRRRYGDEMDELLRDRCGWGDVFDVAKSAASERLIYSSKRGAETMQTFPGSIAVLVRKPSAIAPIIMSTIALAVVLISIATMGTQRQSDEGAAAHIWQLLMAGQLPMLIWFAFHWLRHDVRAGLPILGIQIVAFSAALLPVWLLGL
jgi:hypothetical protein